MSLLDKGRFQFGKVGVTSVLLKADIVTVIGVMAGLVDVSVAVCEFSVYSSL